MIQSFFKLRSVPETESTNDDVKQAALTGEPEGLVVQALRQTKGRGRQGRNWESPEGNLYMSLLLRPGCSPQEAAQYGFVAALAVHGAVKTFLPQADIKLKWPNDVLVNGKKISGILLEASPADENNKIEWLVVGIGMNVEHHPEEGVYPSTSLLAEGLSQTDVQVILQTLLGRFWNWYEVLRRDGFIPVRFGWLKQAKTGRIVARLPQTTIEGEFSGLDAEGRLILRLADGTEKAIAAADVFFPA